MAIYCCNGCVAPKRYPGCHSHCPEYLVERAEHDRRKAIYDKEKRLDIDIYTSRDARVYKAMKYRRTKKV